MSISEQKEVNCGREFSCCASDVAVALDVSGAGNIAAPITGGWRS